MRRCFRLFNSNNKEAALLQSLCGAWNIKYSKDLITTKMNFHLPEDLPAAPIFRIMDNEGQIINPSMEPKQLTKEIARKMMQTMVQENATDVLLLNTQRTGVISFYMTAFGEEAAVVGSAAALKDADQLFLQYREHGALAYRGMSLKDMVAQCMGNVEDAGKGRQMPIHYGSPQLNAQTVSSPLGTQIPQAAGAGYAYKLEKEDKIVVCYLGDGCASEGDFHTGLNFAATRGAHTLFFCRNNGFAISTPTVDQYAGDGIVMRGVSYGIPSIRVDGNDAVAVFAATTKAREIIREKNTPVLIEAMTYRVSHHSTSDDSTKYRTEKEIALFDKEWSPIVRFEKYLGQKGWWTIKESEEVRQQTTEKLTKEIERQKKVPLWPVHELFTDTWKEAIPSLKRQEAELLEHSERYKDVYEHEREMKKVK